MDCAKKKKWTPLPLVYLVVCFPRQPWYFHAGGLKSRKKKIKHFKAAKWNLKFDPRNFYLPLAKEDA